VHELNLEFDHERNWETRKENILQILANTQLELTEINRYSLYSTQRELPYTRNLVHNHKDDKYSLIVLCWNPGFESKIHNHPVEGCFVMPLRGSIVETQYTINSDGTASLSDTKLFSAESPGVSFMADSLGLLHKIANPSRSDGAVTLHLYTPSYTKCKVWLSENCQPEERVMSFFSSNGVKLAEDDMIFDLANFI